MMAECSGHYESSQLWPAFMRNVMHQHPCLYRCCPTKVLYISLSHELRLRMMTPINICLHFRSTPVRFSG